MDDAVQKEGGKDPVNDSAVDYESLYKTASASIAELTAERDSLRKENEGLRAAKDTAIAEGAKARELNYTLARQLDLGKSAKKSAEEYLGEMFLNIKEEENK